MGKTVPLEFDIFARDRSGPVFDKFGNRVRTAGNDVGFLTQQSKNLIAAAAGYVVFDKVGDFLRGSIEEGRESVKVNAQTEAAILSTGSAANITAKQIGDLSESISLKIGVDDEAIQSGANLLLTFKNVRNEVGNGNQVFNRATVAANDLAAAGFGSIESSSKMLGKALNDPLLGITALGRAGVTFTEQQKEQIKALVETGDLLSAQKMILKEVESQVGGSAEAQADSLDKLTVAWANIKEEVGTALLPYLYDFADYVTKEGVPAGERFAAWLKEDGIPATMEFAEELRPLAESILPALAKVLDTTADAAVTLAPAVKGIIDAFLSLPPELQAAIILGGGALKLGNSLSGGLALTGLAAAGGGAASSAAARTGGAAAAGAASTGNPAGLGFAATAAGAAVLYGQLKHNNEAMFQGFQPSNRIPGLNGGGKDFFPDVFASLDVNKLKGRVAEINAELAKMQNPLYKVGPAGDSFDELQAELGEIQTQIDSINARPVGPQVALNGVELAIDQGQTLYERLWNIPDQKNVMTDLPNYGNTEPKARTIFELLRDTPNSKSIAFGTTGFEDTKAKLGTIGSLLNGLKGGSAFVPLLNFAAGKPMADGGPVIGPGGPRDDVIPIMGSNGENMWSAADVAAAGGQSNVERIKAAVRGGLRMADGGPVGSVPIGAPAAGGPIDLSDRTLQQLASLLVGPLDRMLAANIRAASLVADGSVDAYSQRVGAQRSERGVEY